MSPKILIADDDYDNRTILKEAMGAAGFDILQAVNGQEAIDVALAEKPDLILLDLSMPKLSGWEAAKRMRLLPEIAKIPIFAFTAHALEGDEAKAMASGCDDYISKPCIPREFVRKVTKFLANVPEKS